MSDIIRTALKGGGRVCISIDARPSGDFQLMVTEDWSRLSAVERAAIPVERLAAAEDPDETIREEVTRLVRKAHMNWEVNRMVQADE